VAPRVIVVGAGPVGVVAALACVQHGFAVVLLEGLPDVDESPRAATTHPATLEMIDRVGLIEPFIAAGLVARYFQFWDRPTRTRTVEFDHDLLRNDTPFPFVVQTEQHKLAHMGVERLRALGTDVRFDTRVTSVQQDADTATVLADGPGGPVEISGDYVIGADGGRSTIRKSLGIDFEGYTWPERFLVLTALNDFERALGCCYRNYFADPHEWFNLFKVAGDDGKGRWRAVFPTLVEFGSADPQLLDRYERRRRPLIVQFVQEATIANKKRLEERDPAARLAGVAGLRATAADPVRHRQFLLRTSLIESVRTAASID